MMFQFAITTVYIVLSYVNLVIQWRFRSNALLLLLSECAHFTAGAIYSFLMVGILDNWFTKGVFVVFGVINTYLAVVAYDRWNNRHKRRKGLKVTGKVGLRLGRLVIVPET